mmetsp:Transcript_3149/g.11307  ORF Transcript_3149/g.11307 Transcript_3149/m.11307 type:complete len:280 (-) Transcript_3149:468-1307(-)
MSSGTRPATPPAHTIDSRCSKTVPPRQRTPSLVTAIGTMAFVWPWSPLSVSSGTTHSTAVKLMKVACTTRPPMRHCINADCTKLSPTTTMRAPAVEARLPALVAGAPLTASAKPCRLAGSYETTPASVATATPTRSRTSWCWPDPGGTTHSASVRLTHVVFVHGTLPISAMNVPGADCPNDVPVMRRVEPPRAGTVVGCTDVTASRRSGLTMASSTSAFSPAHMHAACSKPAAVLLGAASDTSSTASTESTKLSRTSRASGEKKSGSSAHPNLTRFVSG